MNDKKDANARLQAGEKLDPFAGKEEREPLQQENSSNDKPEHKRRKPRKLTELIRDVLPRIERRMSKEEKPVPLPWSHVGPQLGGGLWPGLHILVGGTGTGKTQWALQVAIHAARQGTPVLYVALELGELDLVARYLGLTAQKEWSRFYLGEASEKELASSLNFEDIPLYFEVGSPRAFPYDALSTLAREIRTQHPEKQDHSGNPIRGSVPFLVIVDFLQIIGDSEQDKSRDLREKIGRAAYEGRAIALEMDAAVLLVSSTARANYQKTSGGALEDAGLAYDERGFGVIKNPEALIGLGKESGEIEFAADSVTVLARWHEALPAQGQEGSTAVLVATAKQRPGRALWSELRFNGSWFSTPSDGGRALRESMQDPREEPVRNIKPNTKPSQTKEGKWP